MSDDARKKLKLEEGMGLSMLPSHEARKNFPRTVKCFGYDDLGESLWFDFPIGEHGLPRVGDTLVPADEDRSWKVHRVEWHGTEPILYCEAP